MIICMCRIIDCVNAVLRPCNCVGLDRCVYQFCSVPLRARIVNALHDCQLVCLIGCILLAIT